MNFLVYDQMVFTTGFNVEINSEVLFATFNTMTMSPLSPTNDLPIFNGINMTPKQYSDFWVYTSELMSKWQDFFNEDVFANGVPLPYWKLSFLT